MGKVLRWGIVSAGNISHDWAVAASTLPKDEHQVLAVAARNKSAAEAFAQEHNIPRVHASYEELFKDPEIGECLPLSCHVFRVICKTAVPRHVIAYR